MTLSSLHGAANSSSYSRVNVPCDTIHLQTRRLDLQVDRGSDFKAWRNQCGAYLSLSGLDQESPATQVQALTLFARETVTVVDNLGLSEDQRKDVKEIVSAIQRHVEGQVNESVERRNFLKRVQQPGETFDDSLSRTLQNMQNLLG